MRNQPSNSFFSLIRGLSGQLPALPMAALWLAAMLGLPAAGCAGPAAPPAPPLGFADASLLSDATSSNASTSDAKPDGAGQATDASAAAADGALCTSGVGRCDGGQHQVCEDGVWLASPCPPQLPLCDDGQCLACTPDTVRCAKPGGGSSTSTKVEQCAADGSDWLPVTACAAGEVCLDGQCAPCVPGSLRCEGGERQVCDANGPVWTSDPCPNDQPVCHLGQCYGCVPSSTFCAAPLAGGTTPTVVLTCDEAGVDTIDALTCEPPLACYGGACRICLPGETRCASASTLQTCTADGLGWTDSTCPAGAKVCSAGACRFCEPAKTFCPAFGAGLQPSNKVLQCNASGTKAVVSNVCEGGQVCSAGQCGTCAAGQTVCLEGGVLACDASGSGWQAWTSCQGANLACGKGMCACSAGATVCAPAPAGLGVSNQVATCNADGLGATLAEACGASGVCVQGACLSCQPGAQRCQGSKVLGCPPDGASWQVQSDCADSGKACVSGQCLDLCDPKTANPTHFGCAFAAAALPAGVGPHDDGLTLSMLNPNDDAVEVTVSAVDVNGKPLVHTLAIAAKAGATLALPIEGWVLPPPPVVGMLVRTYRVTSAKPISVAQLRGKPGALADGSPLWPDNALGAVYRGAGLAQLSPKAPAWLALVNPAAQAAKVSVGLPVKAMLWPQGLQLKASETANLTLEGGQWALLATDAVPADLTGARIEASLPLAVWSGASAAPAPNTMVCNGAATSPAGVGTCAWSGAACGEDADCPQACCGNHVEVQLWPVSRWSTVHVVPRLAPRTTQPEASVLRVVADQPATQVAMTPPIVAPVTLAAGQWLEVVTAEDVVVVASKPVAVVQAMVSSQWLQATPPAAGDPMLQWVAPVASAGSELRFAVPLGFAKHTLAVAAPSDAAPLLDGNPVAPTANLGASGWSVWRVPVASGTHTWSASRPWTAQLYGWADGTSHGRALGAAGPTDKPSK